MLALFNIWTRLREKLQRRAYRHAYLAEHVRCGIAYQIRALRDQREWKQGELSKRLNKPQSVVCRLEDPNYGKVTVQTLLEVANVFDVALELRFVPYSSFVLKTRDISSSAMHVPSFDDDIGMKGGLYPTVINAKPIKTFNVTPVSLLSEYASVGISQVLHTTIPMVEHAIPYIGFGVNPQPTQIGNFDLRNKDEFQWNNEPEVDIFRMDFIDTSFEAALAGSVGHG